MPILLLTIAIGLLVAWQGGLLKRWTWQDGVALLVLAFGFRLALSGRPVMGAVMLVGSVGWALIRKRAMHERPIAAPPSSPMSLAEARAILNVDEIADHESITRAHRRMIALLHPDRGGSSALAAQVNRARDILLAETDISDVKPSSNSKPKEPR